MLVKRAGPIGTFNPDPSIVAVMATSDEEVATSYDPQAPYGDLFSDRASYKPCTPCSDGFSTSKTQSTSSNDCVKECPCGESLTDTSVAATKLKSKMLNVMLQCTVLMAWQPHRRND